MSYKLEYPHIVDTKTGKSILFCEAIGPEEAGSLTTNLNQRLTETTVLHSDVPKVTPILTDSERLQALEDAMLSVLLGENDV